MYNVTGYIILYIIKTELVTYWWYESLHNQKIRGYNLNSGNVRENCLTMCILVLELCSMKELQGDWDGETSLMIQDQTVTLRDSNSKLYCQKRHEDFFILKMLCFFLSIILLL